MEYNKQNKNKTREQEKKEKTQGLDYVTLPKGEGLYYLLNCQTGYLIAVKKETFCKAEYPTIEYRQSHIKFYAGNRPRALALIQVVLGNTTRKFLKEGILDEIISILTTAATPIIQTCKGGILASRALSVLGGCPTSNVTDVDKSWLLLLKIVELINLAVSTTMFVSVTSIVALLLRLTFVANDVRNYFVRENGIEAMILALASLSFPPSVIEAFKRLSMFSSIKLLDDVRIFKDIMLAVDTIIISLLKALFPSYTDAIDKMCGWASHHFLLHDIEKILLTAENAKNFMLESFRDKVKNLYQHVNKSDVLLQWRRNNGAVDTYMKRLDRLYKTVLNYEGHSRVEPVCFAFEGGPGVGKSLAMNQLYKATKMSHYSHVTKAISDGKDFWDGYNFQDIVTCDDLGQQGVSQFRFLINIVSPVKYPLDCATAELKDTKFFNSKALFFTTNLFSDIHNISKTDMITDITALWRRVIVFKFKHKLVEVWHYSVQQQKWVLGAPQEWGYTNIHRLFPTLSDYTQDQLTAWQLAWFELCLEEKQKFYENHEESLDIEEVRRMKDRLVRLLDRSEELEPQGIKDTIDKFLGVIDVVSTSWEVSSIVSSIVASVSAKKFDFNTLIYPLSVVFGCVGLYSLTTLFKQEKTKMFAENTLIVKKIEDTSPSTAGEFIRRQVKYVRMNGKHESYTIGLISGHYVIVVAHSIRDKMGYLNIYNGQPELDLRMIDHAPYEVLYEDLYQDIAILKFSDGVVVPFKQLTHYFNASLKNKGLKFLHPDGCVTLNGRLAKTRQVWYDVRDTTILLRDNVCYTDLQGAGFCGSILFDENIGICGMHVAGDPEDKVGCSVVWSKKTLEHIIMMLKEEHNLSRFDFKETPCDSGVKIDHNFNCSNPKNSNIVPSPLYGVFPVNKEPVNPSVNGPHTVKDSLKEALCHVNDVDIADLRAAQEMLEDVIKPFYPIDDYTNIKGDDVLAPMKDDTACGIGLEKDRNFYIDFEKGELTKEGKILIDEYEEKCVRGTLDIDDIVAKETIKDETRSLSKKQFPRTFRIIPLHINFVLKRYLGNLFKQLVKEKWFTGLMLQINPYTEFATIHSMIAGLNFLALDVAFWDKKMVVQIMNMVKNRLVEACRGNERVRKCLHRTLVNIIQGYVAANDSVWWLTHSLASGTWITTMFNSIVQLSYVRMWYNHMRPGKNTHDFYKDLKIFILGDDIICGVSPSAPELNAFTMRDYYESLGLKVTSSTKGPIMSEYESIEDVTFLKRRFWYHPELKRIVGVLTEETLLSSISWVDSTKDISTVVIDKIRAFQLEAYLNPKGEEYVETLEKACLERSVPFTRWPRTTLKRLFEKGEVRYTTFDGVALDI